MVQLMMMTLIANILNIFRNAIFIYRLIGVPELGTIGVAISTMFSRFVTIVLISPVIYKKMNFTFSENFCKKLPLEKVKDIFRLEGPIHF